MRAMGRFGSLAIFVIAVVVLSGFFVPRAYATNASSEHFGEINGITMKYHYLTAEEMNYLKKHVGVFDPNKNYNKIVDGHGTGLAPPSDKDWKRMMDKLKVTDGAMVSTRALPTKVDLSKTKYFPPIGNQGQQGSCAAWAVTYYGDTYIEAKDNNWDASSGNRTYLMSPAWTYNKINNGLDQGSTFTDNAEVIKNWGAASIATMPYFDSSLTSWGSTAAMREAPLHRVKDYSFIENNGSLISTIKSLINQGIPVNFGIDADIYDDAFKDGNYIISSSEYSKNLTPNHGQTIIGYDDTITDDGDVGAFKIANSWGSSWGDHGFYWVTYKAFKDEVDYNDQGFPMYLIDEPHYKPTTLAILEFNHPPEWDVNISFTFGTNTKPLYYGKELPKVHVKMPNYIAYDISDIVPQNVGSSLTVNINITGSEDKNATIDKVYLERYTGTWGYIPGFPSQLSQNLITSASTLPFNKDVSFNIYPFSDFNTAIDSNALNLTIPQYNPLHSHWVSEPYVHMKGNSAMQTVPVGDNGRCVLKATVYGPGLLTFSWKVSSEENHDILYFYVENKSIANISGERDWSTVSALVGGGVHNLTWVYQKDGTGSAGQDMAWLDNVVWEKKNDKVPSAPTNPKAVFGNNYVNVTWGAPVSNGGADIWGYYIYRGINGTNYSRIGHVDNKTFYFNDTTAKNGVNYTYFIRAENYVGLGNKSELVTGVPGIPGPVLNLKAKGGSGAVTLTWNPPSYKGGADITEYKIYRKEGDQWILVGTVSGDKTSFIDKTVKNNRFYEYRVSAVNKYGEGPMSETTKAQTADLVFGSTYMSYTEFSMYIGIIVVIIVAIVLAVIMAKKKKAKKGEQEEEQEESNEEENEEEE